MGPEKQVFDTWGRPRIDFHSSPSFVDSPMLTSLQNNTPVFERLTKPLMTSTVQNPHARSCSSINDLEWLETGVLRVIGEEKSGRGFLQKLCYAGRDIAVGHFFGTLRSDRRLKYIQHANESLLKLMKTDRASSDPLSKYEDLSKFDIHAGDGHFHIHATHDERIEDSKRAVEHFYSLNLRTYGLWHLTMAQIGGDTKREHYISAVKRQEIEALRQGAKKGRKVLYVWDRAAIDFMLWEKLKQRGIYFVTRSKSNLKFTEVEEYEFDKEDTVNKGVLYDQLVKSKTNENHVRRVIYRCPFSGKTFSFLTNMHKAVRPGLVAHLYKMRWDVEKIFDEIKNKLNEKKSWSSHPNGKVAQANFICITHNLLRLLEDEVEKDGVENKQDKERRECRTEKALEKTKLSADQVSVMNRTAQRVTQRSIVFIRWLREYLLSEGYWSDFLSSLRMSYVRFGR